MPNREDVVAADCRYADIRAQFDDLDPGAHVALFYDSPESQLRVAAAFVASALQREYECLYLTDDTDPEEVFRRFREAGIDVDARFDAGDLRVRPAAEAYLEGGHLDVDRIVEALATAAENVDDDHEGFCAVGENSWCYRTEHDFDDVAAFEAAFDARRADLPAVTLCQYGLDDFDDEAIATALRSHEYVVYRETLCRNPYYVPPEEHAGVDDPEPNAALMLEQTYDIARSRRRLERHEQRLSVLNRILRHDIRNDLNVVLGNVSTVQESEALDDADRERLATVERVTTRIVDRAEKARYVQRTLADSTIDRIDLGETVADAVADVHETYPEVSITVDVADAPTVLADVHLRTALVELLTNAVVHGTADDRSATIAVSRTDDLVTVEVHNPGEPIPERDRRALRSGIETPLSHGHGLGLWLVKWIVENFGGTLRFPGGDPDECRIAIDLRPVEA
ncbi:MEDS domain-containing protein [Haloplanus salilacus]|uniref:MEDS domain-containing protein n=1 Tax=Haloplanus salilacus TaxID=2949994 RepID=UPI0030CB95F3